MHMQFRFVCVVCIEQGPVFQVACFLRCYRMAHKQSRGCTHACCSARDLHGKSRLEADASGHVRGMLVHTRYYPPAMAMTFDVHVKKVDYLDLDY